MSKRDDVLALLRSANGSALMRDLARELGKSVYERVADLAEEGAVSFGVMDGKKVVNLVSTAPLKLDTIIEASGWQLGDGPIPGIWSSGKSMGTRCLWGCKWLTADGVISPEDIIGDVDKISHEQFWYECRDVVHRGGDRIAGWLFRHAIHAPPFDGAWPPNGLTQFIRSMRHSYSEFLAPWSLPNLEHMQTLSWRPGWQSFEFEKNVRRKKPARPDAIVRGQQMHMGQKPE